MSKFLTTILAAALLVVFAGAGFAKDVKVKAYTKKDGTHVKAHIRHIKDKGEKKSKKSKSAAKSETSTETKPAQ